MSIQNMESAHRFHLTQAQGNGTPGMSIETTQPGDNGMDSGMASKPGLGDLAQVEAIGNQHAQRMMNNYVTALTSGNIKVKNAANVKSLSESQAGYNANLANEQAKATVLAVANNMNMSTPNIIAMADTNLANAVNESVATQGRIRGMFPGLA